MNIQEALKDIDVLEGMSSSLQDGARHFARLSYDFGLEPTSIGLSNHKNVTFMYECREKRAMIVDVQRDRKEWRTSRVSVHLLDFEADTFDNCREFRNIIHTTAVERMLGYRDVEF